MHKPHLFLPSLSNREITLGPFSTGPLAKPTLPGGSTQPGGCLGTCRRQRLPFTLKCPCRFPERKRTAVAATISFFPK